MGSSVLCYADIAFYNFDISKYDKKKIVLNKEKSYHSDIRETETAAKDIKKVPRRIKMTITH